jgi:hypothetical protein
MPGCAYLVGQRVYLLRDGAYYDGGTLGSKRQAKPVDVVCRAVPASAAAPAEPPAPTPEAAAGQRLAGWLVHTVRSAIRFVLPGSESVHVTA